MQGEYNEVATLWDSGVGARITRRVGSNGMVQFSYQLFRPYEKDGQCKETRWMSRRHIPAVMRLLHEVNERIKAETEKSVAVSL